jgi:hypothetical protein
MPKRGLAGRALRLNARNEHRRMQGQIKMDLALHDYAERS